MALIGVGLSGLIMQAQADGQLMVMPAKTTMTGQENKTVQVSNVGDKTLYLNIELVRIDNPGLSPEKKTTLGDIAKPQLIVTPAKLTLGPGQKRDIHLTALASPAQETVYRLYIVPVSSIKIVGDDSTDKIRAPLTFGIGYGVVIYHRPQKEKQTVSWTHACVDGNMILKASGTVHVTLTQLEANPNDEKLGHELKLFPGTQQSFLLKKLKGQVNGQPFDIQCP
ncbi:molecular chaperone [Providencia rettgeri]|uniref:fimbrial biogenesis chaperone n=1 Tax=Providencia rettgeri TaxID=587 RepID=UPI001CA66FA6